MHKINLNNSDSSKATGFSKVQNFREKDGREYEHFVPDRFREQSKETKAGIATKKKTTPKPTKKTPDISFDGNLGMGLGKDDYLQKIQ